MHIRVRYFATLRRALGRSEESLAIPPDATWQDVVEHVVARHPQAAPFVASLLVTRNQEWAERDTPVADNDEIGLMPPVSGG